MTVGASINPGNSGGPALNFNGDVVALITLKASKQEGITFGIPMDDVLPELERVKNFNQRDKKNSEELFLANSLFKRLHDYGSINLYVMSLYIKGMALALENSMSAQEGFSLVSEKVDEKLYYANKAISPAKIDKNLKEVYKKQFTQILVRENMFLG